MMICTVSFRRSQSRNVSECVARGYGGVPSSQRVGDGDGE
jgi:hypothetical protein